MRSLLTCYAQFLSFYCKRKPPRTKPFIENVTTTPFDNIEEALKRFLWDFEKGDFHHWVDLFNHFDAFFEKYIKPRKDLQLEVNELEADPPFPREAVLQILRVIRIILENCTNKHFYSSYEKLIFLHKAEGVATTLRPYWSEAIGDLASVVQAIPDLLETVHSGTSKEDEVEMLLDHFGASPIEFNIDRVENIEDQTTNQCSCVQHGE